MEGEIALAGAGGVLTVREDGPRAVLEAARQEDGRGLYKVWLTGGGGELLLGTLVPEGGALRLRRTLPVGELARLGLWPVTAGESRLAFSFGADGDVPWPPPGWRRERGPGRLLCDGVLRAAAGDLGAAALRREGEGFALAFPWEVGGEFPLTPLFCFARREVLAGESWAVFRFDAGGWPVFPPEGE